MKILLVEDSPSDALLLQETLQHCGTDAFEVTVEERLEEGLKRLRRGLFDVVLLDLSLPDSKGHETYLRARAAAPHTPILVLTGAGDEAAGVEAVRHGVQDYLVKGEADGRQIARAIRYAIERERLEQALQHANEELGITNLLLEQRVALRTTQLEHRSARLQTLTAEMVRTEERARRQAACTLHEHLQQLVAAARYHLASLRQHTKKSVLQAGFQRVEELLGQCLDASRWLTTELSPPILYEAGLAAALVWLGQWCREKHGLLVEVEADPQTVIEAQETQIALFHAVRELLLNAVQRPQGKAARVRMERTRDRQVRIVVSDQGAGFDPTRVGTEGDATDGFSLESLRERLELLGGRLEIENAPGRGGQFTLYAPLREPSPARAPMPEGAVETLTMNSQSASSPRERAAPIGQKIRVMLADDHSVLRDGLRQVLQAEADLAIVGEATDGQQAVNLARKCRPDVIIMDISMPRLDGIEATRLITAELPSVRVIGLSMFNDPSQASAMRAAGAVGYVEKSGPAKQLVSAIRDSVVAVRKGGAAKPEVTAKRAVSM